MMMSFGRGLVGVRASLPGGSRRVTSPSRPRAAAKSYSAKPSPRRSPSPPAPHCAPQTARQHQKNQGHEIALHIFHVSSRNGRRRRASLSGRRLAAGEGSEPSHTESESAVLSFTQSRYAQKIYIGIPSLSSKFASRSEINQHKGHQHAKTVAKAGSLEPPMSIASGGNSPKTT